VCAASVQYNHALGISAWFKRSALYLLRPPPPRCACTGGLRFIRRARELGFGIEDIRALLALSARELASCAQARDIAVARLADVRAKRDDLAKLETILADTIAQCDAQCGSGVTPACPVLEVLQA
jgi:MerR family transcriptional regulator, mercuric resistance operon regulatory protein